jgi:hypothetical protein
VAISSPAPTSSWARASNWPPLSMSIVRRTAA